MISLTNPQKLAILEEPSQGEVPRFFRKYFKKERFDMEILIVVGCLVALIAPTVLFGIICLAFGGEFSK